MVETGELGQVTGSGLERIYTTKEGDTLADLAAFFYGDPGQAQRLIDDNPDLSTESESLPPGTPLRVPEDPSRGDAVTSS